MLTRKRDARAAVRGRLPAILPAALLALLVTAVLAGCGDDLAEDQVARVGDATIEREEFDHWLRAAAAGQQAQLSPGGAPEEIVVPDPPEFTECVSARQEQAQAALEQAPGGPQAPEPQVPGTEEIRAQCEQEYDLLKEQVMQFLIQAEAILQEADDRGIAVTDEEVRTQLEDVKGSQFQNDQDFQEFLEGSGMTEEDLLFRVRLDILIGEIRSEVIAEGGDITDEQVAAYYEENKNEPPIGQPEQRELQVIVTDNEREAEEAREAIEDGDPFAGVAEEFSIDPASSERGGRLTVQQGSEEEAFDEAVFSAEQGELTGPVESELGWYVFEVTDVRAASEQTLEEAREAIVQILTAQREQEALQEFQGEFEDGAREKTVCAEDFTIAGCSNGPEPEEAPDPGVPPGAPPGGAPPPPPPGGAPPPQGAPPGGVPPGAAPEGVPPEAVPPPPPPEGEGGAEGTGGEDPPPEGPATGE